MQNNANIIIVVVVVVVIVIVIVIIIIVTDVLIRGVARRTHLLRRDPGQVLHSQLLMRFGVKLRFSVRAVVGSASEWESGRGAITSVQIQCNTIQYNPELEKLDTI